jgi:hypothetical protein
MRSIGHLIDFDTDARRLTHQASDDGANVSEGSDGRLTFDGYPEDGPNLVHKDVRVLGRRPVRDHEAGRSKLTGELPGSLGRTLVNDANSHVDTLTGLRDSYGAVPEISPQAHAKPGSRSSRPLPSF